MITFPEAGQACDFSDIRAVLLDLDGTLIDTLDEFEHALGHMLTTLALPAVDRAFIAVTIGKGSEHLVRTVLGQALQQAALPHQPQDVQALLERAMQIYFEGYDQAMQRTLAHVYPGVREGLQTLADKGYPMAVVTNKPGRLAQPLLAQTQLDAHMAFLFSGDSFERRKPDPYPLLQACQRLGSTPAQTLMIGDSANDAAAAHAAGCPVVLLRYGFNHGEPIEGVPAEGYADSIAEIAAALPAR